MRDSLDHVLVLVEGRVLIRGGLAPDRNGGTPGRSGHVLNRANDRCPNPSVHLPEGGR